MKGQFPIEKFSALQTPFYYYDTRILRQTLETIRQEVSKMDNAVVHYAIKANANPQVLRTIREYGLGADCVSGGEIKAALQAGFAPDKIVFAGVGKADWEILEKQFRNSMPDAYSTFCEHGLSPLEIRTCILLILNHEESVISGLTQSSGTVISTAKSRANKKLFNRQGASSLKYNLMRLIDAV